MGNAQLQQDHLGILKEQKPSYNSVNLVTPLLILVHLLLIVGLWGGVLYLQVSVCFLGFVVLFWQHLHNNTQDVVGTVTHSQPSGGKDTPKKTQQQSKPNYIQRTSIKA